MNLLNAQERPQGLPVIELVSKLGFYASLSCVGP